jgi:hypothetical protein
MYKIFSFIFFGLLSFQATAQDFDPASWFFVAQKTADGDYNLLITVNLAKNWNIYSQYLPSDDGPVKTTFTFKEDAGVQLVGKMTEEGHKKEGYDALFGMNVIKFSEKVVFTQKVKVKKGVKLISGVVNYMTCDNESCLPPKDVAFEIQL